MPTADNPRRLLTWGLVALVVMFAAAAMLSVIRGATSFLSLGRPREPEVSQAVVLERLQEVAKLVAGEMVLRDVVIYEQTRFRSTKRALLVATGKVSAGIDLRRAQVQIDEKAKRVDVSLPPAQIFGVEVLSVTTYDEQAGLLNPFTPEDRDAIQTRIRTQLRETAKQSRILEHADQSAVKAIESFLKLDGYTVKVRRPLELKIPGG